MGRLADARPEVRRDARPSSLFCGEDALDADGVLNWESEFCRYLGFFISWYWNRLLLALLRSVTGVFGGRPRRFPDRADILGADSPALLRCYFKGSAVGLLHWKHYPPKYSSSRIRLFGGTKILISLRLGYCQSNNQNKNIAETPMDYNNAGI